MAWWTSTRVSDVYYRKRITVCLTFHLPRSQYSADWGDYISFAHHLRKRADDEGVDLLLVDTGDRIEGNGLYDASQPKGNFTYDIFREQTIDILCPGNHELYQADAADREWMRTVPNFKSSYIASNLDYVDPKTGNRQPMAQRYRVFETKNQRLKVAAFGFIFDFTGNANNTVVQPVEETVKEQWFQDAIEEKGIDLFVVIGHVGIRMDEFKAVFTAIRKANWFTPIAFFGGHVHIRDAARYDNKAFAIASGRYFETIGFMSISGIDKKKKDNTQKSEEVSANNALSFSRRYIDNNLLGLYHHSGLNETTFPTEHGRNVSAMIAEGRKALKLDKTYGCAPKDLWMSRTPYDSNDSIFTWLKHELLPAVVVNETRQDIARLAILNTGTIRFDIFKGAFTVDSTYIVCPFINKLVYVPDVPYSVAAKVIQIMNAGGPILESAGKDPRFMKIPELWQPRDDFIPPRLPHSEFRMTGDGAQKPLGNDDNEENKPDLVSGYTTKDDVGSDGDDAEHEPITFYNVPNCIQAEIDFPDEGEPETVDLVFLDFIQPWVIVALKFSGGDYSDKDVKSYVEPTLTELMAGWIKENWKGDC